MLSTGATPDAPPQLQTLRELSQLCFSSVQAWEPETGAGEVWVPAAGLPVAAFTLNAEQGCGQGGDSIQQATALQLGLE